jgi:Flp pilus assembly protein TadD
MSGTCGGCSWHRQNHFAEAIAFYRKALASDPGFAPAARDLAVALHQEGEREAAHRAYESALELEPGHAQTRVNLGLLLLELGDVVGAKNELAALRSLGSDLADALERRLREKEPR